MVVKLLGHTQVQTTASYAHLARNSVKASTSKIADSIGADIMMGEPGSCTERAAVRLATDDRLSIGP